jgi:DNA repair protein RadC
MKKECVSEIELVYRPAIGEKPIVQTSYEAYVLFKEYFDIDTISIKEQFVAMYLNQANRVLGIQKLTEGGITNTLVDTRILFGTALKSLATGIIVCHNHPSGNINLSNQDKLITNRIKEIGQLLEIRLLDHLIITPFDSYVSMSDENLI